jgi:hypothetical protein
MPTAIAPGWRGPERAEPGMSARAGEPPALLLELPLCRAYSSCPCPIACLFHENDVSPSATLKGANPRTDLALRKHEVNPASGRLQYVDLNRTT